MTTGIANCTTVQGSFDSQSQVTAVRIHCPFTECDHCHTGTGCPIWQGKIRCCWYSEKWINLPKIICCCKLQNSKIQKSHLFWHIRVELTNCIDTNTRIYISVIFQCKTWTGSCLARRKPFPMHTGRVNGKGIFIGELICFFFFAERLICHHKQCRY